jgi:hypothetical protein
MAPRVGLLLRFYSGRVENAVLNVTRATVRFDDFATRPNQNGEQLMVERP